MLNENVPSEEALLKEASEKIAASDSFMLLTVNFDGHVTNMGAYGNPEYVDRLIWDFMLRVVPDIHKFKMGHPVQSTAQAAIDGVLLPFKIGDQVRINGKHRDSTILDIHHTAKKLRVTDPNEFGKVLVVYAKDVAKVD